MDPYPASDARMRSRGTHLLLGASGALVFSVVAIAVVGARPALVGYLVLAAASGALLIIDATRRLLPNRIVIPTFAVLAAMLVIDAVARGDHLPLLGGLLGAAVLFVAYLLLALLGGMGMGDVKLAAVLGLALGALSWTSWAVGVAAGFALGALAALGGLLTRRWGWRSAIPFGPAMIVGAWLGVLSAAIGADTATHPL